MNFEILAFSIFATIAIAGSLMVVFGKNPVTSAFSLVLVFFSFSGLYALIGAHLIAALQILVYTGAIMVLFVFVVMLLNQDSPVQDLKESGIAFKILSFLTVGSLVTILVKTALVTRGMVVEGGLSDEKIEAMGGNLKVISESLFTEHSLTFEITSFVLLSAIVSTIALSKRKNSGGGVEA